MKLRRMLALTLVLMTLMTAALAADDPGLYYIGDEATPENLTGHTQVYNAVDAAPGLALRFRGILDGRHARVQRFLCGAGGRGVLRYSGGNAVSVLRRAGARPESYQVHVWDSDEATDAQMPFEIRVKWGK